MRLVRLSSVATPTLDPPRILKRAEAVAPTDETTGHTYTRSAEDTETLKVQVAAERIALATPTLDPPRILKHAGAALHAPPRGATPTLDPPRILKRALPVALEGLEGVPHLHSIRRGY